MSANLHRKICLCAIALLCARVITAQSSIQYVYDELGRVIAVVDPSGNTATYTYDAVGNVLAIGQHASSQVSIIAFSPTSGRVGTTVTIHGTGFSATPSSNTVTFNGTSATVSSASATALVVTVPSGATTGTIGVTAPGGSATSASSFTVTTASFAPTITSFSPTIGTVGTSVTITGTNFDPTEANDRVWFNVRAAPTSSATSTSIATAVPVEGTTGHLTVATAAGQAVSTAFFFVPPSPYTAADVTSTDNMTIASSKVVTISTSGKVGLIAFDGTAGQRVSLKLTSSTISSTDITIFNPDGSQLGKVTGAGGGGGFIDAVTLPATATYLILFDPQGAFTGAGTVNLYSVTDLTASPGSGTGYAATFGTPGQNLRLSYSGTAGERISVNVTSVSLSGGIGSTSYAVTVLNPDGSQLSTTPFSAAGFVDAVTLPTTGTYIVLVDPANSTVGSLTATSYLFNDVTGSITPGGSAVSFSTSTPGQNGRYTFSGTAGDHVSLTTSSSPDLSQTFSILNPDGSTLVSQFSNFGNAFIGTQSLATTGTYTVMIDPTTAATGGSTLTLYSVVNITGSITADGTPVTPSITTPGQTATYTFSGTAGQKVSLNITGSTIAGQPVVSIKNPNGSTLWSGLVNSSLFMDSTALGTTGTYSVTVVPQGTNTGSMTLKLYTVVDGSGTIAPGGSAVMVTTSTPGQNYRLTFSGTATQKVSLALSSITLSNYAVSLLRPDGTTQASVNCCLVFIVLPRRGNRHSLRGSTDRDGPGHVRRVVHLQRHVARRGAHRVDQHRIGPR